MDIREEIIFLNELRKELRYLNRAVYKAEREELKELIAQKLEEYW
jgi:hypothetical protein